MINVGFLNRCLFTAGIIHSLLVCQAKNWRTKTRPAFRFMLLVLFTSQIRLITKAMDQLSPNAWNAILGNLFEPVIFFCFLIICMFGCLALAYTIMAGKVMKSLVG